MSLFQSFIALFRGPELTLYERVIAELDRMEAEARRKHKPVKIYRRGKGEIIRWAFSGKMR